MRYAFHKILDKEKGRLIWFVDAYAKEIKLASFYWCDFDEDVKRHHMRLCRGDSYRGYNGVTNKEVCKYFKYKNARVPLLKHALIGADVARRILNILDAEE